MNASAVTASTGMERNPADLAKLKHAAAQGNGESARQVWVHYLTVEDRANFRAWLQRAAELGDCNSIEFWEEALVLKTLVDLDVGQLPHVRELKRRARCN